MKLESYTCQLCICNKYLFVVDDTTKYAKNVVETIKHHSHFIDTFEKVVYIERT